MVPTPFREKPKFFRGCTATLNPCPPLPYISLKPSLDILTPHSSSGHTGLLALLRIYLDACHLRTFVLAVCVPRALIPQIPVQLIPSLLPSFFLKCHLTGLCIDPSFNLKVPTSDSTISSFFISYFISLCSTHDHLRPCHFYLFILWVLN